MRNSLKKTEGDIEYLLREAEPRVYGIFSLISLKSVKKKWTNKDFPDPRKFQELLSQKNSNALHFDVEEVEQKYFCYYEAGEPVDKVMEKHKKLLFEKDKNQKRIYLDYLVDIHQILCDVYETLSYNKEQKIYHCDVAAQNIIKVMGENDRPRFKLIDYCSSKKTRTGKLIGHQGYGMAPIGTEIDLYRNDMHNLGIVILWSLSQTFHNKIVCGTYNQHKDFSIIDGKKPRELWSLNSENQKAILHNTKNHMKFCLISEIFGVSKPDTDFQIEEYTKIFFHIIEKLVDFDFQSSYRDKNSSEYASSYEALEKLTKQSFEKDKDKIINVDLSEGDFKALRTSFYVLTNMMEVRSQETGKELIPYFFWASLFITISSAFLEIGFYAILQKEECFFPVWQNELTHSITFMLGIMIPCLHFYFRNAENFEIYKTISIWCLFVSFFCMLALWAAIWLNFLENIAFLIMPLIFFQEILARSLTVGIWMMSVKIKKSNNDIKLESLLLRVFLGDCFIRELLIWVLFYNTDDDKKIYYLVFSIAALLPMFIQIKIWDKLVNKINYLQLNRAKVISKDSIGTAFGESVLESSKSVNKMNAPLNLARSKDSVGTNNGDSLLENSVNYNRRSKTGNNLIFFCFVLSAFALYDSIKIHEIFFSLKFSNLISLVVLQLLFDFTFIVCFKIFFSVQIENLPTKLIKGLILLAFTAFIYVLVALSYDKSTENLPVPKKYFELNTHSIILIFFSGTILGIFISRIEKSNKEVLGNFYSNIDSDSYFAVLLGIACFRNIFQIQNHSIHSKIREDYFVDSYLTPVAVFAFVFLFLNVVVEKQKKKQI